MNAERLAFGERLRRHRERRGITLEAISRTTKIAMALFAGLERGDCSRWPAGLYSRAYVRAYAETVGLSADDTVEEFAALFSGTSDPDAPERSGSISRPNPPALRLSMVDEPPFTPGRILRRASLAGADLAVALALAWATYAFLDSGVWLTVASGLTYQSAARVVSDEPLVCWLYRRLRSAAARDHRDPAGDEVPVGDAARTTA